MVSDFSSSEYWTNRFEKERSFEWLANTRAIGPIVLELVKEIIAERSKRSCKSDQRVTSSESSKLKDAPVHILHFGCGTSSLGPDLARLLLTEKVQAQVMDADYVAESIHTPDGASATHGADDTHRRVGVPLINLDVLDRDQLAATAPEGGWDLLIDKSTADAISCGPNIRGIEPIHILCDNLSSVTRPGGRWLCISYSVTRFDHLKPPFADSDKRVWRLLSATTVNGAFTGDPDIVDSGQGGKSVVYAPETNVWAYVLERI